MSQQYIIHLDLTTDAGIIDLIDLALEQGHEPGEIVAYLEEACCRRGDPNAVTEVCQEWRTEQLNQPLLN